MRARSPTVVLAAPGKVNLFLKVLHRRDDGFHELETLFQAVDVCDQVTVTRTGSGVQLDVDGPDLGPAEENLAWRAARAFLQAVEAGPDQGVRIHLEKRIPAGAGLGGGSSDAAAVLRCMELLWERPLGAPRLAAIAAGLGSDVPFFLGASPLALGRGRGEVLTPLGPLPEAHLVLVLPPVHVATGGAYAALARSREGRVPDVRAAWDPTALAGGWSGLTSAAVNDFEEVVPGLHPPVAASLAALRKAGAGPVLLSGSGAACFGLVRDGGHAAAAAEEISASLGWPAHPARTLARLPRPRPSGGRTRGG